MIGGYRSYEAFWIGGCSSGGSTPPPPTFFPGGDEKHFKTLRETKVLDDRKRIQEEDDLLLSIFPMIC